MACLLWLIAGVVIGVVVAAALSLAGDTDKGDAAYRSGYDAGYFDGKHGRPQRKVL